MLKAGFARRSITPEKPMHMAGFDRRTLPAEGALDALYVSVLALQKGEDTPFLLCAFDLLGTDRTLCAKVRESLPVPARRVWVCATHTHSAPSGAFSGGERQDDAYISSLLENCKAAALAALEDLSPAEAFWGETAVEGIASLRDKPREEAQYAMPLLSLQLRRERDTLHMVRYACHPTVLDERNLLYSRDLPGAAGGEKTLYCNGPCADLSTRFTRTAATPQELKRLGKTLKSALDRIEYNRDSAFGTSIHTASRTLDLPYGKTLRGEARIQMLTELRQKAASCTDPAARREFDSCIAVLERGERALPETRTVTVAACDLGSRLLLALPFEVGHADGDRLVAETAALRGKPAHVICYCGGYDGYLPHETVGISYEDIATGYTPAARAILWQAVLDCAAETLR